MLFLFTYLGKIDGLISATFLKDVICLLGLGKQELLYHYPHQQMLFFSIFDVTYVILSPVDASSGSLKSVLKTSFWLNKLRLKSSHPFSHSFL